MNTPRLPINNPKQAPGASREVLLFLLLLGLWLFTHPWQGIWHDARLYALQALAHVRPEAFRNDLFFFSGSQDDYTFFSPIYATFIRGLGLHAGAMALLLAGYVLWVGSAVALLRGLLRGFPFWLGLVLIVAMPRGYGGHGELLRYAESFLTPRLFAEGFTLLSLALTMRSKWSGAALAIAAAFAMHPLMALAGAGFMIFFVAHDRPISAAGAIALGTGVLVGLALFNVEPFSRLLATMDKEWFELAFSRSPFVFWDGWKPENWLNRVLLSFSLLTTAGVLAKGVHRRAFLACLSVGCASLLFTWLGTSAFHNVLLIQIQPWRSLWLVQLFSYVAAAWLVAHYWHGSQFHRVLLFAFLTAGMTLGTVGGVLGVAGAALFIWGADRTEEVKLSSTSIRLLFLVPLAMAILWVINSWLAADSGPDLLEAISPRDRRINFVLNWIIQLLGGVGGGLIAITLLVSVWTYGPDPRKPVHLTAVAVTLFIALLSIATWYRPNQYEAYYEKTALKNPTPSFSRNIPEDAVVYWEKSPTKAWFALGRSHYASQQQTAGILFSRASAIEAKRRADRLMELGTKDGIFGWLENETRRVTNLTAPNVKGIIYVCADPALHYIVLSQDLGLGVIEHYFEKKTGKYYFLYDCSLLRKDHSTGLSMNN